MLLQILNAEPQIEPSPPEEPPMALVAEPALEDPDLRVVDRAEIDALRGEVAALRTIADEIRETQVKEGSFVRKAAESMLIDRIYHTLFGSGDGGSPAFGQALTIFGFVCVVLRFLRWGLQPLKGKIRRWALFSAVINALSFIYLVLSVVIFGILAFSRGEPAALEEAREAKIAILETTVRLEEAIDTRLRLIDERLAAVEISGEPGAPPQGPSETRLAMHAELLAELAAIKASSEAAADKATEAAGHSTGWGWHFFICLLIVIGVVIVALLQIASSPTLRGALGFR